MTAPLFIDTCAVAELLGLPPSGFLARRAGLIADHGFPQPMPYARRPLRWRRDRVLAWVDLYRAVGGGWSPDEPPQASTDPARPDRP